MDTHELLDYMGQEIRVKRQHFAEKIFIFRKGTIGKSFCADGTAEIV